MSRKVIGEPKYGLALRIEQSDLAMSLTAGPDPVLLYLVVGAAIAVGIAGSLASPQQGVATFLAFAFLFAPLLCSLGFGAMRVRTRCTLDKGRGRLVIDEQSYFRRVQESYPLEDVRAVVFRRLPAVPFSGSAASFGVLLHLPEVDYLAACGNDEGTVGQDAWRVSRFLNVPLETPLAEPTTAAPTERQAILRTAFLYVLLVGLAIAALLPILGQLPGLDPGAAGLLGVVMISEISAIVAFAYYRSRHPYQI